MTGNLKTGLTTGNLKTGLTTGNCQGPVVKPVFKKRQGEGNFYLSIVPVFKGTEHVFFGRTFSNSLQLPYTDSTGTVHVTRDKKRTIVNHR